MMITDADNHGGAKNGIESIEAWQNTWASYDAHLDTSALHFSKRRVVEAIGLPRISTFPDLSDISSIVLRAKKKTSSCYNCSKRLRLIR